MKPFLELIRTKLLPHARNALHDTSGDDHPITLPVPMPRGVYTAPYHTADGRAVIYAVDSKGVLQAMYEVSTVGDTRDSREELERLLDRVDRQTPRALAVIAG